MTANQPFARHPDVPSFTVSAGLADSETASEHSEAIRQALGSDADRAVVTSTKSMTGHLLGAAGALESVATVLALHHRVVPPTINLDDPDPDCDLDYVPHVAREEKVGVALSNAMGLGGHNGCVLLGRAG